MKRLIDAASKHVSHWMEIAAGVVLIAVMLLIGFDIAGRIFGHPVPGAYEIVSLAGGLILGLALPATSRAGEHVTTDVLTSKLSDKSRRMLAIGTRCIGIGIFLLAGFGTLLMGIRLKDSGEVTAVLAFQFYYVAYALGGAFLVHALVLFSDLLGIGEPERTER